MIDFRKELASHGYRILDDGGAVIIISANGKQERETFNLMNRETVARRYDSVRVAYMQLVRQPITEEASK